MSSRNHKVWVITYRPSKFSAMWDVIGVVPIGEVEVMNKMIDADLKGHPRFPRDRSDYFHHPVPIIFPH